MARKQTNLGRNRQIWNDMTKCFVDPELYDKPVFNYQSKPVNPNDMFSKTERKAVSVVYVKEPTVPFTQKNLDNYTLHVQTLLIVVVVRNVLMCYNRVVIRLAFEDL